MISKVDVKTDIVVQTKRPYLVTTGDILLVKRMRGNDTEELLVRVHSLPDESGYGLAALDRATIFKIEDEDNLYTGKSYITTGVSDIEILGICDVDITVKNIKCYME